MPSDFLKVVLVPYPVPTHKPVNINTVLSAPSNRLQLIDSSIGTAYIINADGENATDWTDSNADGLANDWDGIILGEFIYDDNPFQTYSIINNVNGFTNRAQRVETVAWTYDIWRSGITQDISVQLSLNKQFDLYFTYRSNVNLYVYVFSDYLGWQYNSYVPANTDDAIDIQNRIGVPMSGDYHFTSIVFAIDRPDENSSPYSPNWFELDKITLKEV